MELSIVNSINSRAKSLKSSAIVIIGQDNDMEKI